jgi:protein SEY1
LNEFRDRFINNNNEHFLFQQRYKKSVPIDGFNHYASQIWQTIQENKDLDIPTQKEMLALFRCGEISKEILISFEERVKEWERKVEKKEIISNFGKISSHLVNETLETFKNETHLYAQSVVTTTLTELKDQMKKEIKNLSIQQLNFLKEKMERKFEKELSNLTGNGKQIVVSFDENVKILKDKQVELFKYESSEILYPGENWDIVISSQISDTLSEEIDHLISEARNVQIERILEKEKTKLDQDLTRDISDLVNNPTKQLWEDIRKVYSSCIQFDKLSESFQGLKLSKEEEMENEAMLKNTVETIIHTKVSDSADFLSLKMHNRFDEEFRYTKGHVPRIWKDSKSIKLAFNNARNSSLELIDLFFLFRLNKELDSTHITLPSPSNEDENDATSFQFPEIKDSTLILKNSKECKRLYEEFVVKIETTYSDAQRTMMLHAQKTHIPMWLYGLIVVLGWNEFVWIFTNPIYLIIFLVVGSLVGYSYAKQSIEDYLRNEASVQTRLTAKLILQSIPFKLFDLDDDEVKEEKEKKNK